MGYKVQKGDGWYRIAKNTGMDVNELLKLNNATLNTVIHPGQEIKTSKTNNTDNTSNKTWAEQSSFAALAPKKKQSSESMPTPYRSGYTKEQYIKDNAKSIQQQLVDAGYDLGKYGVDGKWGKTSQAALDKALADGYKLENGKLSKPSLKPRKPEAKTVQDAASDKVGEWIDSGIDTVKGWVTSDPLQNTTEAIQTLDRKITPRQYTAAQNTVADLIGAPLRRGVAAIAGEEFTNAVFPTRVFNEDHLSNELYSWLQDAIDKKWGPEERKVYFEQNPNAEVKKGWKGRLKGANAKESDYQKYYDTPYTGPMQKGFGSTMFGEGIDQAQGTLGSFDLIYTKDGAYVVDDWDFGTGSKFDTSTMMGKIRQAAEDFGSQEDSNLNPTRSIKAFIRYKD